MITRWIIIHRASYILGKITEAYIAKFSGKWYDRDALWFVIGVYQSRIFGLCIYRPSANDEKLVDDIVAKAKEQLKPPTNDILRA